MNETKKKLTLTQKRLIVLISLAVGLFFLFIASIFIGSSNMSFVDGIKAIFHQGEPMYINIIYNIRFPRIIAALLAGIALALSGTIMQTITNNVMASPSTLGTTNAAVLGANIAIIILGGGVISVHGGNVDISNPYFISGIAFLFALLSTLLILFLSKFNKFSNTTIVLIGVTMGTLFTGITTLIQYFASDTSLSSAVYWSFGDLGRASYEDDLILFVVVIVSLVFFLLFSFKYNALLLGEESAESLGINLKLFKFISLLLASLLTAVTVSLFGIIGFIGLLSPQIMRRLIGNDHRYLIVGSGLFGAFILLFSDILSRVLMNGISLPVGAITAILGAPAFVAVIILGRRKKND